MKKTLISVDNLDEFICGQSHKLYNDGTKILTAGAKDELSRRGISIVYGPDPGAAHTPAPACGCAGKTCATGASGSADFEQFVLGVAALLKKECGITDPGELRALSLQAVKTIKENI